jgi:ribosomal protein S18 acetylase RimI-like enzyme
VKILTQAEQWPERCAAFRRTAGYEMGPHPDLAESHRVHGTVHTTGGRILPGWHIAATRQEQEARLADRGSWLHHVSFEPVYHAVQGARAYNSMMGLGDPHAMSYEQIHQTPETVRSTGRHYDSLPNYDPRAESHYDAMAREVGNQHDFMTNRLGIKTQAVDYDPYSDVHEMLDDINNNKRLKVLGTQVTGSHPYFSDEDNDKFRAVHDFFGHAATGRSFDRHGEQAAYLAHSQMFTPQALPALASETKGQNTSLILNGNFPTQKLAVMNPAHYADGLGQVSLSPRRTAALAYSHEGDPERFHTWHAHDNGTSVGYLDVAHEDIPFEEKYRGVKPRAFVSDLWVHPDYQRQGIATQLWERAGRPLHMPDRQTPSGAAWARSVGGGSLDGDTEHQASLSPRRTAMPTYYHVTDNPNFKLDPNFTPEHIGYDSDDEDEKSDVGPGIYLTQNPDLWRHSYPGRSDRGYNAQFDTTEDLKNYPEMTPDWSRFDREMGVEPEQYFVPSDYFNMLTPKGVERVRSKL